MKPVKCALVAGLVVLGLQVQVEAQGRGNGHKKTTVERERETTVDVKASSGVQAGVHVVFSNREVQVIREHYAPRYRNLPPGLQKKLARTGKLPPGWQKKMEPFPVVLERQMVALPAGYQRGVIDGHAVIYKPGTSIIIDATILF
jgi:hypothetical protein